MDTITALLTLIGPEAPAILPIEVGTHGKSGEGSWPTSGQLSRHTVSGRKSAELGGVDRPDVLVADLGMPIIDGFELIRRLRASPDAAVRDTPAAALMAYARSEDRAKTLQSGFEIHLAKPVDPAELIAAVKALARRRTSPPA